MFVDLYIHVCIDVCMDTSMHNYLCIVYAQFCMCLSVFLDMSMDISKHMSKRIRRTLLGAMLVGCMLIPAVYTRVHRYVYSAYACV